MIEEAQRSEDNDIPRRGAPLEPRYLPEVIQKANCIVCLAFVDTCGNYAE
jgi:hypothetical protein